MTDVRDIVDLLNEALKADPEAINKLVSHRVECNDTLADHPTIITQDGKVGLLGILNGLLHQSGTVAAAIIDSDKIRSFIPVKTT